MVLVGSVLLLTKIFVNIMEKYCGLMRRNTVQVQRVLQNTKFMENYTVQGRLAHLHFMVDPVDSN